ncbi:hypothetical protein DUI87_12614 [Hirundo rustica rustica]|uniref:Uncharacterized protein n=1 Tax=Hirundo rustica rustica TaxID=333673 RepID=A0A3M0KEC9_HIRRU|nr:hypothetical protein DUI87_12614 [Hirundo rustica rustica]
MDLWKMLSLLFPAELNLVRGLAPLALGSSLTPLALGSSLAPLAAGSSLAPLALGSSLAPLALGSSLAPLALGSSLAPLALGSRLAPLALGSSLAPLALGSRLAPLALGSRLAPLALGSSLAPLALGSRLAPLALGSRLAPLALGSSLAPLALGSRLAPLALGSNLAPLAVGSRLAPLALGSSPAPLALGSSLAPGSGLQAGTGIQPGTPATGSRPGASGKPVWMCGGAFPASPRRFQGTPVEAAGQTFLLESSQHINPYANEIPKRVSPDIMRSALPGYHGSLPALKHTTGSRENRNCSLPERFVVGLEANGGGAKGWKCLSSDTRAGIAPECPWAREKMPFHHVTAGLLYKGNYLNRSLSAGSDSEQLANISVEELDGNTREISPVQLQVGTGGEQGDQELEKSSDFKKCVSSASVPGSSG